MRQDRSSPLREGCGFGSDLRGPRPSAGHPSKDVLYSVSSSSPHTPMGQRCRPYFIYGETEARRGMVSHPQEGALGLTIIRAHPREGPASWGGGTSDCAGRG